MAILGKGSRFFGGPARIWYVPSLMRCLKCITMAWTCSSWFALRRAPYSSRYIFTFFFKFFPFLWNILDGFRITFVTAGVSTSYALVTVLLTLVVLTSSGKPTFNLLVDLSMTVFCGSWFRESPWFFIIPCNCYGDWWPWPTDYCMFKARSDWRLPRRPVFLFYFGEGGEPTWSVIIGAMT